MTVIKEPTQTNTADGIHESVADSETVSLLGYDNGDDVETSKREALAESGRWARVEALYAISRSVLVATLMQMTFCDEKMRMERLELVKQGLNKPCAQPWLTIAERVVKSFCSMFVASALPAQAVWSEGTC